MNPESRIQEPESQQRAPAKSFGQLIVWQKAHQFVLGVYRLTENFPNKKIYGLTAQLRRAAVSIPANIAEGFKKRGRADNRARLAGRMPLLYGPDEGFELRGYCPTQFSTRRSQQIAGVVHLKNSGFWLLTPEFFYYEPQRIDLRL